MNIASAILFTILMLVGCENEKQLGQDESEKQNDSVVVEQEESVTDVQDGEESNHADDEVGTTESSGERAVTIYYIDDETAEVIGKTAEIKNENDIWTALQETNMLNDECQILSFRLNEQEKTIDLDFNNATGERIRSMGTTGETEILGCLINTYLDAYQCEKIKLTEEGNNFETGHGSDYSTYVGKIEF